MCLLLGFRQNYVLISHEQIDGCDPLSKSWSLDEKDLKILTALDGLGGNASAQQISDYIHDNMKGDVDEKPIPARTVRYRISTLMERGVLLPSFLLTDERKIGLGEGILVLEEVPGKSDTLEELIQKIPIFYWHVPTHGRYDGYLVHTIFDLTRPDMITSIADSLQKKGYVSDYSFFDIVDNEAKKIDFTQYNSDGEWSCDWITWRDEIRKNLTSSTKSPFTLTDKHEVLQHDHKDVMILRVLKNDPNSTTASLTSITGISAQQVRDRIQKLREKKVIKGYARAYGFAGDLLWFSCFIEIDKNSGGILKSVHDLPFPGVVLMESESMYCIRFGLSTSGLKQFLEGFKLIRPHLKSYYFQFHLPDKIDTKYGKVFDLYDRELDSWNIPIEDYLKIIK
ncbi:MAG: winged helix-turn-helix transcriptional regulator [Candidatus Thorarchaeota archaeon]|jgi:DNA-binding Lrp family transcriptional regulator